MENQKPSTAMVIMWLVTILCCIGGAVELSAAFAADSAPKQAAGAALAAGCAIIPYCISRALHHIAQR